MVSRVSLVPSSSAAHGITYSQNVARDVAERITALQRATVRSRAAAWIFFLGPVLATAMIAVTDAWPAAFVTGYVGVFLMPIGAVVHGYRRRALKQANALDRDRDVAWVSRKDGLIFFSDDGVFLEKRGGYKPYGVQQRRFTDVSVRAGTLVLHGMDSVSGATYAMEMIVPDGWTDEDTQRVRDKLDAFRMPPP